MDLIVIISLIIIDLLLLKQYNQQSNILLSFLKHLCEKVSFAACCFKGAKGVVLYKRSFYGSWFLH
ncbi:hypothetical protein [Helicobacter pylori]|uniref:hypothetical protein n=1 Tax=Helicobacter pylori TaxID=210 RepID=UPI00041C3FFC